MGYSFRAGIHALPAAGPVGVIQTRDLGDVVVADATEWAHVEMEPSETHLVRQGDIAFRSRGDSFSSAIVHEVPEIAVLAAPLLRIRVTDTRVLPAYLNWFINQPPAQAHFAKSAEGGSVKMINKTALENLEVDAPSLERQEAIVALAALATRERHLVTALGKRRTQFLSEVMMNHAQGGTR